MSAIKAKDIILKPIGFVSSSRREVKDDYWDREECYIELTKELNKESFYGLSDFSHVEVIFFMDQVKQEKIVRDARHPRNRDDWPKVGIFAQRGKNRPNQLGLTICEILRIDGKKLYLKGLDAVDGTSVLDIKPWVGEFGPRGNLRQPQWISELMKQYWE